MDARSDIGSDGSDAGQDQPDSEPVSRMALPDLTIPPDALARYRLMYVEARDTLLCITEPRTLGLGASSSEHPCVDPHPAQPDTAVPRAAAASERAPGDTRRSRPGTPPRPKAKQRQGGANVKPLHAIEEFAWRIFLLGFRASEEGFNGTFQIPDSDLRPLFERDWQEPVNPLAADSGSIMGTTFTPKPITLYICDTCDQLVSGNAPPRWGGRHWDVRCAPVLHCKGTVHEVKYAPLATAAEEGK